MEALAPASPDGLPARELLAGGPFWHYRSARPHRVLLTPRLDEAGPEPGHLAVVTEPSSAAVVTESAGHVWAALPSLQADRRRPPSRDSQLRPPASPQARQPPSQRNV